jgi:predicted RecB family endonuclease
MSERHPGLCIRENVTASCLLCNYVDQLAAKDAEIAALRNKEDMRHTMTHSHAIKGCKVCTEVERLYKRVEDLESLTARAERLREALEKIEVHVKEYARKGYRSQESGAVESLRFVYRTSTAALGEEK